MRMIGTSMTLLSLPWILSGAEKSPLVSHPQLAVKRPTFTRTSADSEEGEILSLCRTKAQHAYVLRSARRGNGRDFVQSFGRIEAEARPALPRR